MRNARLSVETIMVRVSTSQQPPAKHVSHAEIGGFVEAKSGWPALGFAYHEVAEDLDPRYRLQLFRIDEVSVELD